MRAPRSELLSSPVGPPVWCRAVSGAVALAGVVLLGVAVPQWWAGAGLALLLLVWLFLGLLVLPAAVAESEEPWAGALRALVLGTTTGAALSMLLWTLSAYLWHSLLPGTVAVAALAVIGGLRARRTAAALHRCLTVETCLVGGGAFVAAVYLFGANELLLGERVLFTYRTDWAAHLYWAGLVRELGLPLVEVSGAPGIPYSPLYHVGALVTLAGVSQLLQVSLFQAARLLCVAGFVVVPLSALLLVRRFPLKTGWRVLAGFSPLIWASPALPVELASRNWNGVLDPYVSGLVAGLDPAGSLYHNIPQLHCVVLAAGALVAFDWYRRRGMRRALLLCGTLLGCSGLMKPSLLILFAPALIIVLGIDKGGRRSLALLLSPVILSYCVYLIPSWIAELPEGAGGSWELDPTRLQDGRHLGRQLFLLSAFTPLTLVCFARALRALPRRPDASTELGLLLGLAVHGGALFAMLFRVPGRLSQGNEGWAEAAAIVLAGPWTLCAWVQLAGAGRCRALGRAGVLVCAASLLSGLIYLIQYPLSYSASLARDRVRTVTEFADALPRSARVLVHASFLTRSARAQVYLPRRALCGDSGVSLPALDQVSRWRSIQDGTRLAGAAEFIATRDAAVLPSRATHLRQLVEGLGWTIRISGDGFDLWMPGPERSRAQGR